MISHRKWMLVGILEKKLNSLSDRLVWEMNPRRSERVLGELQQTQELIRDILSNRHPATM